MPPGFYACHETSCYWGPFLVNGIQAATRVQRAKSAFEKKVSVKKRPKYTSDMTLSLASLGVFEKFVH